MSALNTIAKKISFMKPVIESFFQLEASLAAKWAFASHKHLMRVQWAMPPLAEHFDHMNDLYYQWLSTRNPFWLERGVFGGLALYGGKVLELSCGDGFNARNFYSLRSRHVLACDFDYRAIDLAKKKNSAPNVTYIQTDIRSFMPLGKFENVVWDGAIEHFTLAEIADVLGNVKSRLVQGGLLSGYTIVERKEGKSLEHHEYEFKSKEDLYRVLKPHFERVTVFETIYETRHNLYFWAADGVLPFDPEWPRFVASSVKREPAEPESAPTP